MRPVLHAFLVCALVVWTCVPSYALAAVDDQVPDSVSEEYADAGNGELEDLMSSGEAQDHVDGGDAADAHVDHDAVASIQNDNPMDLAGIWKDSACIAGAGSYSLNEDVETDRPLRIALEEGQEANIDLEGHDVNVQGARYAIDLTQNKGTVVFDGTATSSVSAGRGSNISLRADNSESGCAVVESMGPAEGQVHEAKAVFKGVCLTAEFDISDSTDNKTAVRVVHIGAGEKPISSQDEAAEFCSLEFEGCSFVSRSVSADASSNAGEAGQLPPVLSANIIDAECPGVQLAGKTAVESYQVRAGKRVAVEPVLTSVQESSFVVSRGFELTDSAGEDALSSEVITLAFPQAIAEKGSKTATVVVPSDGAMVSAKAANAFKAADGYAIESVACDEPDKEGYKRLVMVEAQDLAGEVSQSSDDAAPAAGSQPASDAPAAASSKQMQERTAKRMAKFLDSSRALVQEVTAQVAGVDLNSSWAALSNGLESQYNISGGGTYYLSGDLKTKSSLIIDAPGKDVVIDFRGHVLTLNGAGSLQRKTMLSIEAARTVTLTDSSESDTSMLDSVGESDINAISCSAQGCTLKIDGLGVTLSSTTNTQRNLSFHVVRMAAGTLLAENCVFRMESGNQTLRSEGMVTDTAPEVPSAVYATDAVESVSLATCQVTAVGPQGFSLDNVKDMTSIGNSFAVYSLAKKTQVKGGVYVATSLRGNATCLYGSNLELESGPDIRLEANAGQLASGVYSAAVGSVYVNTPFSFRTDASFKGSALSTQAFLSQVENGFVFGDCAPTMTGQAYPVLVMTELSLEKANVKGAVIGSMDSSLSAQRCEAVASSLSNASPQSGCTIVLDGSTAVFKLDDANAVASINGKKFYSTLGEALDEFSDADELTLLKDAGSVVVTGIKQGVLNLNGHTISSLDYSTDSAGEGLNVSNGSITSTTAVNGARAAVNYHSPSPLALEQVDVRITVSDARGVGVYGAAGAGALTLRSSTLDVVTMQFSTSSGSSATGIDVATGGPTLRVESSRIAARTSSAGIAARGINSTNAAYVADSSVIAHGDTGDTVAACIGGVLEARCSSFCAETSGPASAGYAVWMRTASPVATDVSLDACSLSALSDASNVQSAAYLCLAGSVGEGGTIAPAGLLSLSGSSCLKSSGGVHIGMNVGNVSLGNDFALTGDSDQELYISQSQRDGDVGFTVTGSASEELLSKFAGMFTARGGSWYEGWKLVAKLAASQLVWQAGAGADGAAVELVHGAQRAAYGSMAAALAQAADGDTLRLLGDLAESGAVKVGCSDLTIDLGGHTLTIRAGKSATLASDGTGGAIEHAGGGTLTVANGMLGLEVGAPVEGSAGSVYCGISVTGGGKALVDSNATVNVAYTGSNAASAVQRSVTVQGIGIAKGSLQHRGKLSVVGAQAEGGVGAMNVYGIYVSALAGTEAQVDVEQTSSVHVSNATGARVSRAMPFYEANSPTIALTGLREIVVDEQLDSGLYQEIAKQFRLSAQFDDPNDTTARGTFNNSIYYTSDMVLEPQDASAWYNGLRIWAYSDEVAPADVGKPEFMVPTHIFVANGYEVTPQAFGVASYARAAGDAHVSISGSIEAGCPHGDAFAIDAACAEGHDCAWNINGANLSATSDGKLHAKTQKDFDLRDFIEFTSTQSKKVAYSDVAIAQTVKYEASVARAVRIGKNAAVHFDGAVSLATSGADAADIEMAAPFECGTMCSFANGPCIIANSKGFNAEGDVIARTAANASIDAASFEDAYKELVAATDTSGTTVWKDGPGPTTVFKVGDAVVARYSGAAAISLSDLSASVEAARPNDWRQVHVLTGWSECADENATQGYVSRTESISPIEDKTYYAVYKNFSAGVPIAITNVRTNSGALRADSACVAEYGQTVGEACAQAGIDIDKPSDYTDAESGISYRFIGWTACSSSSVINPLMYSPEEAENLVATQAVGGVVYGRLELRATYAPLRQRQHLVTFIVDGYTSACVVEDGEHPVYTAANDSNTNYTEPAKQAGEVGKTFRFDKWFVDANANGTYDEDESAYAQALPAVCEDVTYTAAWKWKWSDVTYTFYVKHYSSVTGRFVNPGTRIVNDTCERKTQEIADGIAKVGSIIGYGGKIYTLVGWSTRKTDTAALYDADNPLPNVDEASRSLSSTYSRTLYGVYKTDDHRVAVTFFDGETSLGSATVSSASTSVNTAFAATGSKVPADKSESQVFLGWTKTQGAARALEGASTLVESLVGPTDTDLTLYAVFGATPSYRVNLRSADGTQVLYQVVVERGGSVYAALAQAQVNIELPVQAGKCFAGFVTASGVRFGLNEEVKGALDLYATYIDVVDATAKDAKASANATLSHAAALDKALGVGIATAQVMLTARSTADSPVRTAAAKEGYSFMKAYDLRLQVTDWLGEVADLTGDVGTVAVKVYVGKKYRNASVRAFWLGTDGARETIKKSAIKTVDSNGYITVNIGNFSIGDVDEGGNLEIAYIEGGAADAALSSKNDEKTLSVANSKTLGASASKRGLSGSSLSSAKTSKVLGAGAVSKIPAAAAPVGSAAAGDAAAAGGQSWQDASPFGDMDSNGVVLLMLIAAAMAFLLHRLWILITKRKRKDDEADEEVVDLELRYAEGVRF